MCNRLFVWLNCTIPSVTIFRVRCLGALVSIITDFVPCERLICSLKYWISCLLPISLFILLFVFGIPNCYCKYCIFIFWAALQSSRNPIVVPQWHFPWTGKRFHILHKRGVYTYWFFSVFLCFYRFVVSFYDGRKRNK